MNIITLLLAFTIITSPLARAEEKYCNGKTKIDNWGYYYPNGKTVKDNWGTYYPNGNKVFDNWGLYYPNGQVVRDNWGTYYPNGKKVFDNWGCYSPTEQSLECSPNLRVRADIPGFGRVLLQANPKEKQLGIYTFFTRLDGAETVIDIDFETRQISNVEMICE